MNLTDLFSNPITMVTFATTVSYLIATALRKWIKVSPILVACIVVVIIYVLSFVLPDEQKTTLTTLLGLIISVLAAMGVSLGVNHIFGSKSAPVLETEGVAGVAASVELTTPAPRWSDPF